MVRDNVYLKCQQHRLLYNPAINQHQLGSQLVKDVSARMLRVDVKHKIPVLSITSARASSVAYTLGRPI